MHSPGRPARRFRANWAPFMNVAGAVVIAKIAIGMYGHDCKKNGVYSLYNSNATANHLSD